SFDVVIANHMLYHVADRPRAFAEIRRVLGPRGRFHAATNGQGHMRELQDLVPDWQFAGHVDLFGLESAPEQMEPFFTDITVECFDDALEVTEVEPVLAYIRSSNTYVGQDLGPARETVEAAIVRDGAFRVEKHPGLVSARKP